MAKKPEKIPVSGFRIFVDERGVPYSDYGNYHGIAIGRQRSILAVAERGLVYWNKYFSKQEPPVLLSYDWERHPLNKNREPSNADDARVMLLSCAGWLLDRIVGFQAPDFSAWVYTYPISYNTRPGWKSAQAQAVGLQLLARAFELTSDARYLAPTDHLLRAFDVPVSKGGLLKITELGGYWFEKLADSSNDQPMVLNGMLFSLLGLRDFASRTDNERAFHLFDLGIEGCLPYLKSYDLGDWSAYDIWGKRASIHYHDIHIKQLTRLHELTGLADFKFYRDQFLSNKNNGLARVPCR